MPGSSSLVSFENQNSYIQSVIVDPKEADDSISGQIYNFQANISAVDGLPETYRTLVDILFFRCFDKNCKLCDWSGNPTGGICTECNKGY